MAEDEPDQPEVENILKRAAKVRANAAKAVLQARRTRARAAYELDRLRRDPDSDREND
jgi:hypothetical protein